MSYWWASQNKNYRTAIPDGTLWTRPQVNGVLPQERKNLQKLEPDDIIFHYGNAHVRAVSRVVAAAVDAPRPRGYPLGPRETNLNDTGKLVRVELITDGLAFHRDLVAKILTAGSPGPLSKLGVPREAYVSPLIAEEAQALLAALDVDVPPLSLPGRPHENWVPGSGGTDGEVIATIRKEQSQLRTFLLNGQIVAECSLCGLAFPSTMLIAGHIVPRAKLTEAERHDFRSAAMLVCLLGCDALFENGFIVVDERGLVQAGRPTGDNIAMAAEVARRINNISKGWTPENAHQFRRHELVAREEM
jgi:hypothetical protein